MLDNRLGSMWVIACTIHAIVLFSLLELITGGDFTVVERKIITWTRGALVQQMNVLRNIDILCFKILLHGLLIFFLNNILYY